MCPENSGNTSKLLIFLNNLKIRPLFPFFFLTQETSFMELPIFISDPRTERKRSEEKRKPEFKHDMFFVPQICSKV